MLREPTSSKDAWCVCYSVFGDFGKGRRSVLFICYLNWTAQGAKAVKGVAARRENLKTERAGFGGRLVGG